MDVPVAANVLGTLGAVCWSIQVNFPAVQLPITTKSFLIDLTPLLQLVPQIIINYRRHSTIGLQPTMMLLWASAGIPLGAYNIAENFNIALQIQPQILTLLSLITWAQCKYYSYEWAWQKTVRALVPVVLLMGGLEIGLIFALKIAERDQVVWPATFLAVLAAVLLCAGVGRHYWDIWKMRTVRGISFLFVGIDAAGDLTSLISVFFQPKVDVMGMVIYGSELVLWGGVFVCGAFFNLRPWLRRQTRRYRRGERQYDNGEGGQVRQAAGSTALEESHMGRTSSASSSTVFRTASRLVESVCDQDQGGE